MRATTRALAALASAALYLPSAAQTWSNCNPTRQSDCPADSALGKTVNIDFSSKSDSFTPQGNPTYGKDGVAFTISKSGDAPQLTSLWYIMFGKVDIQVKAAPGAGIVSSFVLQSDTLDEIDWEWLGADPDEVQTNYFGKGRKCDFCSSEYLLTTPRSDYRLQPRCFPFRPRKPVRIQDIHHRVDA